MKLFYMPGACPLAPQIVLEWIGIPYEAVKVEKESLHKGDYLKINPLGKVPALYTDEGQLLVEASAILNFLAEKYPDADLGHGSSPEERYELHRWLSHFSANVHPTFWPFFAPARYIDDPELHDRVRQSALGQVGSAFAFLERHMEGRDHVLGDKRTVLDPYLFVFLRWGKSVLPEGLGPFPNLNRFLLRLAEDPGVQRAMDVQGIDL